MKLFSKFALFSAFFVSAVGIIQAAGLDGNWSSEFETQVGLQKYVYEFKTGEDGKIIGKAHWERMEQKGDTDLKNVKLEGDALTFLEVISVPDMNMELQVSYTGKLAGDEIKLSRTVGEFATEELVAKRVAETKAK